jgi:glycine/D-amino acid oxidase-like deaminating enzyme
MRAHIVIIGAGISGLTAAITIGEGVDKLIAAGETIARPEMTLLDAADWIGGARALMSCLRCVGGCRSALVPWRRQEPVLQMGLRSALRSGAVGIDTAARRFNVSVEGAVAP